MEIDPKKVYLAIAMLKECNFACGYCHPFGESKITHGKNMDGAEFRSIIDASHDAGFRTYRLTGGECTVLPWFPQAVEYIADKDGTRINVCTNGSTLDNHLDLFSRHKDKVSLRVSLDSLDTEKRKEGIDKILTPHLAENLEEVSERGIYTRLNVVVTKKNVDEIPAIIRFAGSVGIDVKLLDLYVQEQYIDTHGKQGNGTGDATSYWNDNYVDLTTLDLAGIDAPGYNRDGGFGIPMYSVQRDGITVIFKDSTKGAHFSESVCVKTCPLYMTQCQEGVYTPHVSSNLTLHVNGCHNDNEQWELRGLSRDAQTAAFKGIWQRFFQDLVHVPTPPQTIRRQLETACSK